jgi:hypothetical protein
MERPTAKAEIVIHRDGEYFHIHMASEDAALWCDRELPLFSTLYARNGLAASAYIKLNFDPAEVAEYIRSYNDK